MSDVFRLTFVCTGNTCRSPMAEVIAQEIVANRGLTRVEVGSAGTHAGPGSPASRGALWAAAEAGLDLSYHTARQLTVELIESSDLILTMGNSHLLRVQAMGGGDNAWEIARFTGGHGDVADPFGAPEAVYLDTFGELSSYVARAFDHLETLMVGADPDTGSEPVEP